MEYNLNQSDIFPSIVNIRCGNNAKIGILSEETEKYLKSIIENYKIPQGYESESIIRVVLRRIIDNLYTYNPVSYTYTIWVDNILNNYITHLHMKHDKLKDPNFIGWKWELAYNESSHRQIKPVSELNPFNSIYIKELRKKFLKALIEIDDTLQRKALLLCFQNPLKTKYWAEVLDIDEDTYSGHFVAAVKKLKEIVFEKEKNRDLAAIIELVTEKLSNSIYIGEEELDLLYDKQMVRAINNSFMFENTSEAAGDMGMKEEEYIELFFRSIIELSEKIERKQEKDTGKRKSDTVNRLDLDKQIIYYRKKILHYSLKHNTPRNAFFMDRNFSNYKKLLDFIYLLFTARGRPPSITELLTFCINNNASDLHLSAGLPPLLRIDGDIRRINIPALEKKTVRTLLYNIMNDEQRRHYDEFLDTDFSYELPEGSRFRVNAFNQYRGPAAAFRTIHSQLMSLEEIGEPEILKSIADSPNGLVLITGPTGSGKSTTLAAMLEYRNNKSYSNILTIEDPVEFLHKSKKCLINQREVHRNTVSFSKALRAALREDPDIILVGEMRDLETIRLALTAAETGHLVLATLHTNTAPKAIDRIIDVFQADEKTLVRFMLSESLCAVISQTLIKKIGGGRVAALEIMIANSAIRNLIREEKIAQMYSIIQMKQAEGMQTRDQCLQKLARKGLISPDEAYSKAFDKKTFKINL